MVSKFIIFAVVATLVQSSFAQLSEEQKVVYGMIISNEKVAIQVALGAVNVAFDVFAKLSSQLIYNLVAEIDDTATQFQEVVARLKEAIDYAVGSILLIREEYCYGVEFARNTAYTVFDNLYVLVFELVALVGSGNFDDNQARIEEITVEVEQNVERLVATSFNAFRTCLDVTDSDTLAAIQTAEERGGERFYQAATSILNTIKVYAAAVSAGSRDNALIFTIEENRSYGLYGLRKYFQHFFSLIRAFFIKFSLNLTGIVSDVNSIEYSASVLTSSYNEASAAIFERIRDNLSGVALGLTNPGDKDYSLIDAAQCKTAAHFRAALDALVGSVLFVDPSASAVAAEICEYLIFIAETASAYYYDSIRWALNATYEDALINIELIRNQINSEGPTFSRNILELIRNGRSWDEDTEAKLTELQSNIALSAAGYSNAIAEAVTVLVEAIYACQAGGEDFTAVQALQNEADSMISSLTSQINCVRYTILLAGQPTTRILPAETESTSCVCSNMEHRAKQRTNYGSRTLFRIIG